MYVPSSLVQDPLRSYVPSAARRHDRGSALSRHRPLPSPLRRVVVGPALTASLFSAARSSQPPVKANCERRLPVRADAAAKGTGATRAVTKLQVEEHSQAPIARLKSVETWYDKEGGRDSRRLCVLQTTARPLKLHSLEIRTHVNRRWLRSSYSFVHATRQFRRPPSLRIRRRGRGRKNRGRNAAATKPAPAGIRKRISYGVLFRTFTSGTRLFGTATMKRKRQHLR